VLGVGGRNSIELVCPIGDGRGCFLLMKGRGEFRDVTNNEEVVPVGTASQAQAGRDRARDARLKAARERRLRLDPDQLAREQRIDEAVVDVELAWEARSEAEQAVAAAEVAAATALERLMAERLAVKDAVRLTGLDQATVRRLRQLETNPKDHDGTTAEDADAEVA
jgi:hypothetical protein